ncbi:collagen-binding domain-containing protein [Thermodesulfobacteriota bacterium]
MNRYIIPILTVVFVMHFISPAQATLLGEAAGYNVFAFGEVNVTSDAEGRIAAGGNFTATNYSVGLYAEDNNDEYDVGGEASQNQFSLVSGGNVNFKRGTIHNGGIYAKGDIALDNHTINGDVVSQGSLALGPGGGTINGSISENSSLGNPIDFTAAETYLKGVSEGISQQDIDGLTHVANWGGVTFTGVDDLNYFFLEGTDLAAAKRMDFFLGQDDIAIINVSGTSLEIDNFGMTGWEGKQENILFNFFEAEDLDIHNIGFKGSILAPLADITFNSAHIDGTMIAQTMFGSGQYNDHLFDHDVQPVPEPATMLLFGAGLVGLAGLRRKKTA